MPSDLDAVSDGLYRLAPAQFVAARDARAVEARAAGDRRLAAEIKALRRPTQGAWMVNWLARERGSDLGRLLELGAAIRSAQEHMAGEELRTLSRQRHAVVAALAADARRAATEIGLPAGEAASREVEETLGAALADDRAAADVRAGHLSTALRYSGFGPETGGLAPSPAALTSEPASAEPASAEPASAEPASAERVSERAPSARGDDHRSAGHAVADPHCTEAQERKRRLDEAEDDLREAERAAALAHRTAGDHDREVDDAREGLDQLRRSIRDLEARLAALRQQEGDGRQRVRDAEEARDRAGRVAAERDARTAAARARLSELRAAGSPPDPDS